MASLKAAYNAVIDKPLRFIFPLLAFLFVSVLAFFLMVFIYTSLYLFLDVFGIAQWKYILLGLVGLLYFYLESGFFGGLLKGIYTAHFTRGRFATEEYVTYSLSSALRYFIVSLIIGIVNGIIVGVSAFLYLRFAANSLLVGTVIGVSATLFLLIIDYLLFYSPFILALVDTAKPISSIKASIVVSVKEISLLVPFFLYLIVGLTFLIPLVDLLSVFVLYPITVAYILDKLRSTERIIARYL